MALIGRHNINKYSTKLINEFNVTDADLIGQAKGMPLDVFILVLKRVKEQWNYETDEHIIRMAQATRIDSLFRFVSTDEGSDFWYKILKGNYSAFL